MVTLVNCTCKSFIKLAPGYVVSVKHISFPGLINDKEWEARVKRLISHVPNLI